MRVCILGTGLSSLTLAKALINQKINVELISFQKSQKKNKSRTIGISKSNIEFFNKDIINIDKLIWKLKEINIFSENIKKEKILNFKDPHKQLFSIVKNYSLYDLLDKNLKRNKYFKKILYKKKFNLDKDYDLVIVTDNLNSVSKKYFNKKIIKKYESMAYTTIIHHKKLLNQTATQIFTNKGPLAFLPISSEKTSIVFSVDELKKMKSENVIKLIRHYNFKYEIKKISKIDVFYLKSLSLRSYYNNKFLAFGDLLHTIHPLAGQGFNMTIRDIKIILEIIKSKKNLGLPIDHSVNIEFEKKAKHKNFIFSSGIDFIYEFFNLERKIKSNVLSKSVQALGRNSNINKFFINVADKGISI